MDVTLDQAAITAAVAAILLDNGCAREKVDAEIASFWQILFNSQASVNGDPLFPT